MSAPVREPGGTGSNPILVTVAHGTRTPTGNEVARELTRAAGRLLGWTAVGSYVELADPLLGDVLAELDRPAVVVPLLLTTGLHVRQDVPQAALRASVPVQVGRSFGPHVRLAAVLVDRLRQAGAEPGSPVVLVAAGSSDPAAARDQARAAELLGQAWGAPARLAVLSGRGPRPVDVVRRGDAVAPYLLAPGYFSRTFAEQACAAGAAVVAEVLGAHPGVVDLVADRARALASVPGEPRLDSVRGAPR